MVHLNTNFERIFIGLYLLGMLFLGFWMVPALSAQEEGQQKKIPFTGLKVEYLRDHPDNPNPEQLLKVDASLKQTDEGIIHAGEDETSLKLSEIQKLEQETQITIKALQAITKAVVEKLRSMQYMGVLVNIHPEDVSDRGRDLRDPGQTKIRLLVHLAHVYQLRTIAAGDRFADREEKKNLPEHEWVRDQSPLRSQKQEEKRDLLRKDELNDYAKKLSRHPGRRVDTSVGRVKKGEVAVDYLVSENRPWNVFFQTSDTGTDSTDKIRQRLGFIHNQLSGHDDILNLNVSRAANGDSTSYSVSYDFPLDGPGGNHRLSLRGSWNEYTAADVGQRNDTFKGETWSGSMNYTYNFFQDGNLFLDVRTGLSYDHSSQTFDTLVSRFFMNDFFKPSVGLDLERSTRQSNTSGSVTLETNIDEIAGTEKVFDRCVANVGGILGRCFSDSDWTVLKGSFSQSFYLEPIVYGDDWENPDTPETSTLAHEVRFSARGQVTEDRLVSNEKFVVGGLYSVRGYPQSATSGDTGYFGSLEYRYHIPRSLDIDKEPPEIPFFDTPFKLAPKRVYGFPDWDFVATGFFDFGKTFQTRATQTATPTGTDETLASLGFGFDLSLKKHFRFQWSIGYAISPIPGEIASGQSESNFVLTLTY